MNPIGGMLWTIPKETETAQFPVRLPGLRIFLKNLKKGMDMMPSDVCLKFFSDFGEKMSPMFGMIGLIWHAISL